MECKDQEFCKENRIKVGYPHCHAEITIKECNIKKALDIREKQIADVIDGKIFKFEYNAKECENKNLELRESNIDYAKMAETYSTIALELKIIKQELKAKLNLGGM